MTDQDLRAPEHAEALASGLEDMIFECELDRAHECLDAEHTGERPDLNDLVFPLQVDVAKVHIATLRALSAALEDVRSEYDDFRQESAERERDFALKMGKLEARAEAAEAKLQEAVAVMQYLKSVAWGHAPSFETEFHLDVHAECAAFLTSLERDKP